jgi:hypothetical protein
MFLDSLEPDVDIEDNGDDELTGDEEPRPGATTGLHQGHAWKVPTDEADEAEPSLGWVGEGRGFHGMALPGYADDRELADETAAATTTASAMRMGSTSRCRPRSAAAGGWSSGRAWFRPADEKRPSASAVARLRRSQSQACHQRD